MQGRGQGPSSGATGGGPVSGGLFLQLLLGLLDVPLDELQDQVLHALALLGSEHLQALVELVRDVHHEAFHAVPMYIVPGRLFNLYYALG